MASRQHRFVACYLLLAALLSACTVAPRGALSGAASPAAGAAPVSLAGTAWVAIAIDRVAEVQNPKPILRWTGTDRIAGKGGCNGFTGRTAGALENLQIGPLDSTGRACLSMPGSQEDMFFKALETTRKARLERDQLVLMDDAGKQLARFVKVN
jgi:heat shock protein HslJ